jgi:hypothetical protein
MRSPSRYVPLFTALASLLIPAVASGANGFTEQIASARYAPSFTCSDGTAGTDVRMIVETDNFIDAGTTPNPNPPLRVGFQAQCSGRTYSFGFTRAAATQFDPNLKSVTVSGTFPNVVDSEGVSHTITVNTTWTGIGPVQTTVNTSGSKSKKRAATATARILVDGNTLVDGPAITAFSPPFIRIDSEK